MSEQTQELTVKLQNQSIQSSRIIIKGGDMTVWQCSQHAPTHAALIIPANELVQVWPQKGDAR